jgi:acetylornithine deacetylase
MKDKVIAYIDHHKDVAIDFLRELITIDSSDINHGISGREEEAQLFLKKSMDGSGAKTLLTEPDYARMISNAECSPGHDYHGRPNLVAEYKGMGGGRSLILNGHIDTMAADAAEWKHDPWSAEIENGNIYGVGACDMKGGLAAMVYAAKAVQATARLKGDLYIHSVVDEEGGGNGTLDLMTQGYRADGAIIAEPTDLNIMTASRGVFLCKISVNGEGGHPNFKWVKANAVDKAVIIYNGLMDTEKKWLATKTHPLLPRPTITMGRITGGTAANVLAARCDMYYDVEFLPEEYSLDGKICKTTIEGIKKQFTDEVCRICQSDAWLCKNPPELDFYQQVGAHSVETDFELARLLVRNQPGAAISAFQAGCDARHLASAGIKTIIYGPGSMADAHNANEKISIDQYLHCIKTLALTIMDWCGTA